MRKTATFHGYIKWPELGKTWKNSGEGGLSVWAIFMDRPKEAQCCIDIYNKTIGCGVTPWFNRLAIKAQDACYENIMNEIALSCGTIPRQRIEKNNWAKESSDDYGRYTIVYGGGQPYKLPPEVIQAAMLCGNINDYAHSVVNNGLIYLGSTGLSYWSDKLSHYWNAGHKDLTTKGKFLVSMLEDLYGYKAKFVTALDT